MKFLLFLLALSVNAQTLVINSYTTTTPSSLNTNLVAYWALEEASGSRADHEPTLPAQNMTDNNGVTQVTGKVGFAAYFTGTDIEWLSHVDSLDLSVGNYDFSVAGWVKSTAWIGDAIVASHWGTQKAWRLMRYNGTGRYLFQVSSDGTAEASVDATNFGVAATNQWHFVVGVHDAFNDRLRIYINNGTPNTLSSYTTGVTNSNAPWDIGASGPGGSSSWNGALDEVGFWKKALTAAEIDWLWNSGNGRTCCPFR